MADVDLRAPFPWPGGKKPVADVIWRGLGADVPNYIEPFGGSLAVLLSRPGGAGKIETINDLDAGLCNFWRAVTFAPEETARWCDWPVSELDMHARHIWCIERLRELREPMRADPMLYDAQCAGWWVYGACLWIGTGWCSEPGNHKRPQLDGIGKGVHSAGRDASSTRRPPRQIPMLSVTAKGASTGRGVHSDTAVAIHSGGVPSIGNDRGINGVAAPACIDWFRALQQRLRGVRQVSGDWRRVVTPAVLGKGKHVGGRRPTAVYFDPPYLRAMRSKRLYAEDAEHVSRDVRRWCIKHGDDPDLRIALSGYEGEHEMPASWSVYAWVGRRGYAGDDNGNRFKERIWFSPHCLPLVEPQLEMF